MAEGAVEEVIARCLLDPVFADRLRRTPNRALHPYGFDANTRKEIKAADLDKILRFAGFINKVQHNHLWEFFPITRKMLCYYGIELEVFTAYRVRLSPQLRAGSLEDKTRSFLDFLEHYLSDKQEHYPGLSEALQHERGIWEVSLIPIRPYTGGVLAAVQLSSVEWKTFQKLVPAINGPWRICLFEADPEKITAEVKQGTFNGLVERTEPTLFAYTRDRRGRGVVILKPDHLTIDLLSRIDGKRSVAAVIAAARRESLLNVPPLGFREFFEQAAKSEHICMKVKET